MKNVLICYNTKTGSTKEVAERICEQLKSSNFKAEVKSIDSDIDLDIYDACIIGAPINGMKWKPGTTEFISNNQEKLSLIPIAYFSLSLSIHEGRDFFKKNVRKAFNDARKIVKPDLTACFGGATDTPLPTFLRIIFGLPKNMPLDQRNWQNIEKWTLELINRFSE